MNESLNTTPNLFMFKAKRKSQKYFPIVYNNKYDISFWGIERCHPFDTKKWGKIHYKFDQYLQSNNQRLNSISPLNAISKEELSLIHSQEFIEEIHTSSTAIANAAEILVLRYMPTCLLRLKLLDPLKWQTAGSILAANEAIKHGFGINLGGGFHHCSANSAEGFCFFADISLIMKYLWNSIDENLKFLIVDLDAHQGNGYARDKWILTSDDKIYILDMFNPCIYPNDNFAKALINTKVELKPHITDTEYLNELNIKLTEVLHKFKPNLIIYNAGTDILLDDPLGNMDITGEGIKQRDEYVFTKAKENAIPIVMLTSGGYQHSNADIIANSLINLYNKNLIHSVSY